MWTVLRQRYSYKPMSTHFVKTISRVHSKMEGIFQSVYIPLVPVAEIIITLKDTQADIQYVHTHTHTVTSERVEQMLCRATRFDQDNLSPCSTKSLRNINMSQFSQWVTQMSSKNLTGCVSPFWASVSQALLHRHCWGDDNRSGCSPVEKSLWLVLAWWRVGGPAFCSSHSHEIEKGNTGIHLEAQREGHSEEWIELCYQGGIV